MDIPTLILRSLAYYWRTNLAVIAGTATAIAVLSGALLVGQSVRDSLRDILFQRIGRTGFVVSADRFFREQLAADLAGAENEYCPLIFLKGIAIHEDTGARAYDVNVFGIDGRFWNFQGMPAHATPSDRTAAVGRPLALKLGMRPGDGLLVRIETSQGIPRESLYGSRENVGRTVRLTCGEILPADGLGEFSLQPGQGAAYTVFVPLERLQRDLAQNSKANTILAGAGAGGGSIGDLRTALRRTATLQDFGIKLRPLPSSRGISVESSRVILDDAVGAAVLEEAAAARMRASGVFSYLANSIRAGGQAIPYSVITAVDLGRGAMAGSASPDMPGEMAAASPGELIWLNEWAQRDLGVAPGASIEVDYYVWREDGRLETRTSQFRFAGVVPLGGDVDATLAPDYPGITEARSIRSWDPPFPLDLRRIRPKDEDYWNRYRATPKAFVTLSRGQDLWGSRFGKLSSVRIAFPAGAQPQASVAEFEARLRERIDPEKAGFILQPIRERGLEAARGSTDFGEYFVYFSFFLIAAAVLLAALFFRLGIEQRVREIGILQASGFAVHRLQRIFLAEGAVLALGGSALGVLGAIGYGGLLILGLRTWWLGAVGTQSIRLHIGWTEMAVGVVAGNLACLAAASTTLRGLRRNSARALLSGTLESKTLRRRRVRVLSFASVAATVSAVLLLAGSAWHVIPDVGAFFGAGSSLLIAILSLVALHLRRDRLRAIAGRGWRSWLRLGARNAVHRPGRSLLCVAMIALATFIIVSVEAFRKDPADVSTGPGSGAGGYSLFARSSLPLVYDPNSAAGREALGIPADEVPEAARVGFVPFRVRPGDDTSCLNLYAPQEPRILGAPRSFLAGGRFSFQSALAATSEEQKNPWRLLESPLADGAIPAIGDATTIQYIMHLALGKDLVVRGSGGLPVRLRLVAALRDSIFQGELIISEANFLRAFPDREGYQFFLLETSSADASRVSRVLTDKLADWGFDVESTRARLAAYHEVENTYLSTFQSLGGLGLILGTIGLATVLLRNVLERRQELALLRAVGYQRNTLAVIIVAENLALMACGLVCGTLSALLAVMPALHARGGSFPFFMMLLLLGAVLLAGLASSLLAVFAALRSPLLQALRSE